MTGSVENVAPVLEQMAARITALALATRRQDSNQGELHAGKRLNDGTWAWFKVSGLHDGGKRASACEAVADCQSQEIIRIESIGDIEFTPCSVDREIKALLIVL
jgi:hypothetical protein